ncbi:MAG: nitrous oxide reductase family maturation protein NosD [Candidatus Sedimenticola sp. (ex Thyasira tokunagai)]
MKRALSALLLLIGVVSTTPGFCLAPLQLLIELTPPGSVLRPPPGTYEGPIVLKRAITLDGQGKVTIDGGGEGTVLSVKADGAVIRGMHLTHSGDSHDRVDAGLLLEAEGTLIENNTIDDVLFGIHIRQANNNTLRGNHVSSRGEAESLRGDGIRMWYSSDNLIQGNHFDHIRDLLFTNSTDNRIIDNTVRNGRMGMEFIYSHGNWVENNRISENRTGIVVIYSNGLTIKGNRIIHLRNPSGSGFSIKDSSQVTIKDNSIVHCAVGLIANAPVDPVNIIYLYDNLFAYNDVALYFYGEKGGHVIHGNRFQDNFTEVLVSSPSSALANDWRGNYWDGYQGFDRGGDGVGDTPHTVHTYSDRIWRDRPMARFYRGSPMLEFIDFAERLAPFSKPDLILRDPTPRVDSSAISEDTF